MSDLYVRYPKEQTPYIRDRLRELLKRRGFKARGICTAAGIGRTYLFNLFNGKIQTVDGEKLERILEVMRMTDDEFFERPAGTTRPRYAPAPALREEVRVPLFGEIPTIAPAWTEGEPLPIEAVEATPRDRQVKAFALRVRGDSMSPRFRHGDVIFLRPLDLVVPVLDPDNPVPRGAFQSLDGRSVVVTVHREVTLKVLHVKALAGQDYELVLESPNGACDPINVGPKDEVRFQGEVYKLLRHDP